MTKIQLSTPTKVTMYPYGEKWFLPQIEFEANASYVDEGESESGVRSYSMSFVKLGEVRRVEDKRLIARLLRWGYIKIWLWAESKIKNR